MPENLLGRKLSRRVLSALLLAVLSGVPAGWGQGAVSPQAPVPAKDVFDVLRELLKKPPKKAEPQGEGKSGGSMSAYAPYIAANSSNGFIIGAAGNIAKYIGDPKTTSISSAVVSFSITSKGQFLLSAKLSTFSNGNRWHLEGDNRFNWTSQDTYGLGTNSPPAAEVDTKYNFFRLYETLFRRLFPSFYGGAGFLYNTHADVRPAEAAEPIWEESPYVTYSEQYGFNLKTQHSAGFSVNALFDNRDSSIEPSRGFYARADYRFFFQGFLGGESDWQEVQADLRTYFRLSEDARHKLGLWLYGDFVTQGTAPYYGLPATGMDTYGRTGRGYLQGRYRGEELAYGEIEYRWTVTRNGLFGLVFFLNGQTLSNKETGERLFDSVAAGAGFGARLRMNKDSRTNICLDFGWGKDGSSGFYVGIQEAF